MTDGNRYFLVSKYPTEKDATDIGFRPIGNSKVPDEYLVFKTDIELVVRTINAIYAKDEAKRRDIYEQVFCTANACYSGQESDLLPATQALADIKKTILMSSWVSVRNRIMAMYGLFSVLAVTLFSGLKWWLNFSPLNLPMVLMGCCLGSWLSVSLKTGSIQFDEIYENICQHRSLFLRLIYCCTLAVAVSLFLCAGFIEIKVGDVSTAMIPKDDTLALATGVLFGLGESSLASKLSNKVKETLA